MPEIIEGHPPRPHDAAYTVYSGLIFVVDALTEVMTPTITSRLSYAAEILRSSQ